ncbi:MAG: response regulator [Bacteroidales bacterium]|nr:response regulator [Bacteroidales bacterium]
MKQYNVLIVDDIPKNIQVLGSILAQTGYRVAFATNGQDTLKLIDTNHFDCILLDIMMPGMDGYELCIKLKQNMRSAEIPIIFLTAKNDQESILKGFEVGAQDYVTKPFSAPELIARVKTHIDLVEKTRELANLNIHLEDKVRLRTIELEKANRQLANIEKAKNDFLSIISHELRTPLNGITGLTGLLNQTLLDKEQREYLDYLNQASQRLVRFSDTALLITSLQTKNQRFDLFSVSVPILFEMALDQMEMQLKEKSIVVHTSPQVNKLTVEADADLIRKCLELMLENAIYHLPTHGSVWLTASKEGSKTILSVRDNGAGFPEQLLSHMRDDLINEVLIAYEGLGLSLAAVKLIMKIHNGNILVGNHPDGGAVVSLIFDHIS